MPHKQIITYLKKTSVVALITVLTLIVVLATMGGGHGYFWPAKIVYPYAMILSVLRDQIGIAALLIAVLQMPIYAIIRAKKPHWTPFVFAIHSVSAIICLNLPTETFSG